jgi:hypothetical protein
MSFRLPSDSERCAIVGRTGSGKTQAAEYQLSRRSFDVMPWVVYDFKREAMLARIPGVEELELDECPDEPGLYITHPLPDSQDEVEAHMWQLWERGHVGIYIDEGYMVGAYNKAFNAILTQGRSKQMPMIILSQRPVFLSKFVFSEADFFQVFFLTDQLDRDKMRQYLPSDVEDERLPEYYSYWYDVKADQLLVLKPVPSESEILGTFAARQPEFEQTAAVSGRGMRFI